MQSLLSFPRIHQSTSDSRCSQEDSRSGSKANKFFMEYHDIGIYPYLTITPTLEREDLNADELFVKRQELIRGASNYEDTKFETWLETHAKYRETDPQDPILETEVSSRIGEPIMHSFIDAGASESHDIVFHRLSCRQGKDARSNASRYCD